MCMRVQSPLAQQISQQSAMYSRSFFKSCAAKRFDGSAASCYLVSQRRSLVTSARFNSLFDQVKYLRTSIACHRFCSNEALENSSRLLSFPIIWKAPLDSREICNFWPYLFLDWDQREKKPNGIDWNQRPNPTFTFMFSSKLDRTPKKGQRANVKFLERKNRNDNKNSRMSRRGTSRQNSTKSSRSDDDTGNVLHAVFSTEKGIERGDDNVYSGSFSSALKLFPFIFFINV